MKKKSKGYAKGGMMKAKGYKAGGKMPMAKDPKTGQMVPTFAMDGKGKMMGGGKVMMSPKGMSAGGAVTAMNKDRKKKSKGMAKGGTIARGSGAARPQKFRKNG
jgi:hypothetical protein